MYIYSQLFSVDFPGRHFAIIGVVVRLRGFDRHCRLVQGRLLGRDDADARRCFATGFAVMLRLELVNAAAAFHFDLVDECCRRVAAAVQRRVALPQVLLRRWLVHNDRVLVAGASHEFQPFALCLMAHMSARYYIYTSSGTAGIHPFYGF